MGTACICYHSVSSSDCCEEVRHDVCYCLLSSWNNQRQCNYCNYSIYSDDTDVPTLLFFVIYDAIVTQGASIKHYTKCKSQQAVWHMNMMMSLLQFFKWFETLLKMHSFSNHIHHTLTELGKINVRCHLATTKGLTALQFEPVQEIEKLKCSQVQAQLIMKRTPKRACSDQKES